MPGLIDRCTRCGTKCAVPLDGVTVVYDHEDGALDRFHWTHAGCGLVVKQLTEYARSLMAPFIGAKPGGIRAQMRDREYDDPARRSNAPAFTEADVQKLVRELASRPSAS